MSIGINMQNIIYNTYLYNCHLISYIPWNTRDPDVTVYLPTVGMFAHYRLKANSVSQHHIQSVVSVLPPCANV